MALRTYKQLTIAAGGTPQPAVATTTTSAVSPPSPGYGGYPNPLPEPAPVLIAVADSSIFLLGDHCWIDTLGNAERRTVESIPDATHITAKIRNPHASGVYVTPILPLTDIYIQTTAGNTGALYRFQYDNAFKAATATGLGSLAPNKTGLVLCVAILQFVGAGVQPYDTQSANNYGGNPDGMEYVWIDGTTGDKYSVTADIT